MADNPTRRDFLKTVSLAGAALVAGESTAAAANGERKKRDEQRTSAKRKKVWAWVDENGCLNIDDDELEAQLYAICRDYGSICVTIDVPGSEGNKLNSLCNC